MNLETALEIIKEQATYYVTTLEYLDDDQTIEEFIEERNFHENGDYISEYCVSTCDPDNKLDKTKLYVTQESQTGGEGEGDTYTYVFKIDHPIHGKALIRYKGYYDSWNGTNWDGSKPELVESYEYTAVGYRPVIGE